MNTIPLEQAQTQLPELIHRLAPGEEIVITENNRPVAKLVGEASKQKPALRPPPGLGKGCITILADDDEHLQAFADYMP